MGFFTLPVEEVTNVRIYGSPSEQKLDQQLTLYSQTILNRFPDNKVIVPFPEAQSIRFHSSEDSLLFLKNLEDAFDPMRPRSRYLERRLSFPPTPETPYPRAQYDVDFVGSYEQLEEYSLEHQIIHPRMLRQLYELYPERSWGFLVLGLQEGHFVYEPLVYTHRLFNVIEGRLYFPLAHHYPNSLYDIVIPSETHDWDHKVLINGTFLEEARDGVEVNPMRLQQVPWDVLPSGFQHPLRHLVLRELSGGLRPNRDYFATSQLHQQRHLRNGL